MVWNPGQALLGGRYIIERKLGEGGIGITYLVGNERNELRVIKTLRVDILNEDTWKPHQSKLKQDFRDEAVRLALCRHPHIVQIENIFDEGDLPCMVIEYIDGEDLGNRLRRMKVLPEAEALLYIRQIGDALKVIHSRGLLHRDIKPRNIMLRAGKSEAVLIDFGIAREFIPNVIQRHTVYRTPGFAPPEQYELEAPRGEYIDVYALAATLYSLITGVTPRNADDRRHNIPLEPPKHFNRNISDKVNQAIIRGMDLQPSLRPQSVQEWVDLLDVEIREEPPTQVIVHRPVLPNNQSPPQNQQRIIPSVGTSGNWQCVHTLRGHSSMVLAVAISSDGQAIASASNDHTIKLWQLETGKLLRSLGGWFSGHSSIVHTVAFSPDGQLVASGSWDETIKLWQVSRGKEIRTLTTHGSWINSVAFNPIPLKFSYQQEETYMGRWILASGGADSTVKLWIVSTGIEISTFTGHSDSVWSVAFSPDGELLASGSADSTIKLWQVSTGREIHTFRGHSFFVNFVTFSPDGRLLVSASADGTIKLWQVSTGKKIHTFTGHSDAVCSVTFSPNAQLLVSGSWDKTIKIWQIRTGSEIYTLHGHSNYVRSVAFSPDGQTIVSGSDDDTIKIWRCYS
ncbi:protein kinase [Brasilonema octagenarum UFV-E1]|uniref:Protein kinase n=1 Tax=Brasilonema sennae CENA114 TaxID=415709 RepID=A0A856MBX0_9CYAN|nr:serine/threonine-protein kinase [Brasilonema sennae]QDL07589.1 protein kinase [Brasilonema sennae CENA114]QDL13951.1 protein kinase [Brasilonema octagenarum UFV-E1]